MELPFSFPQNRRIEHLVENRTVYTAKSAELNVFETHHFADNVILQFHQPVFASMIEGKKVMHLREGSFEFLPGESLIMPADEIMKIDFPEAKMDNPTKCLAMTIAPEKINQIVADMNLHLGRSEEMSPWDLGHFNFAFTNSKMVSEIIQRIIYLFVEDHTSKDMFIDSMLKELIVRVVQKQNRNLLERKSSKLQTSNRIAFVIEYIKSHLSEPITIAQLSKMAYMSESNFYRVFKNELGVSPVQFINECRVEKAIDMLRVPGIQVKEVYMACGFNNLSYFVRTFKKVKEMTPSQFKSKTFLD